MSGMDSSKPLTEENKVESVLSTHQEDNVRIDIANSVGFVSSPGCSSENLDQAILTGKLEADSEEMKLKTVLQPPQKIA